MRFSILNKECWKKVSASQTTSVDIRPTDKELSQVPTNGNVLDVGCGDGKLAEWLSKKSFSVSAIDINQNAINANRKRNTKVTFSLQDITNKTTFPDQFFDLLCFKFTLANIHRDEWQSTKKEVERLISPKGFVWLAEPLVSSDYKERYELSKKILNDEHAIFVFKNPETAKNIDTAEQLQNALDHDAVLRISRHFTREELDKLFSSFKKVRETTIEVVSPSGFKINTLVALLSKQ